VKLSDEEVIGYEVLARSRLFGLEMPKDMFEVAARLNVETQLSQMLRWEGVQAATGLGDAPRLLFVNTHPRELSEPGLIDSVRELRGQHPQQPLVLEVHEAAVTDAALMAEIRSSLDEMNIGLAYDDFGAGQSRLNELTETAPNYVKFDMSLVRNIDSAAPQRQEMLAALVAMVRKLGIVALAEGVETRGEHEACLQMGFDLGQGFLYGRPAPARTFRPDGQV
jgi:EAL domain-containing protein (putative c-di-GMP-specific phosphodiesterase class I)